ncbi:hypothetical protein pb186bvf_019972 [Paramecium bursaria]
MYQEGVCIKTLLKNLQRSNLHNTSELSYTLLSKVREFQYIIFTLNLYQQIYMQLLIYAFLRIQIINTLFQSLYRFRVYQLKLTYHIKCLIQVKGRVVYQNKT